MNWVNIILFLFGSMPEKKYKKCHACKHWLQQHYTSGIEGCRKCKCPRFLEYGK